MDLGVTQEELRNLVIERAAAKVLGSVADQTTEETLSDQVRDRIDTLVMAAVHTAAINITDRLGTEAIEPRVQDLIEGMTFRKHTTWGEPKEDPKSWRELLVERAENWLIEPVNYRGQTQDEVRRSGSSFSKETTRIAWMVDNHIKLHIEAAMKSALLDANQKLAAGIMDAVHEGLNAAAAGIKIEVKRRS